MINNLKIKFYTLIFEWKHRKVGYDEVCCCGSSMITKYRWPRDNDTPCEEYTRCRSYDCPSRCQKEYALTSYLKEKINEN